MNLRSSVAILIFAAETNEVTTCVGRNVFKQFKNHLTLHSRVCDRHFRVGSVFRIVNSLGISFLRLLGVVN